MSEWWSYRPRDFLMFAPRTYWRLVELYNQELWPWQLLALAAGAALLWQAARSGAGARPLACAALALAWCWVGWGFHWERHATINLAGRALAIASGVQAVLLLAASVRGAGEPPSRVAHSAGMTLALAGIVGYPLATAAAGAAWARAEVAGLMPEPTALATLGLLLATQARPRAWLIALPLLLLAEGFAMLWLLASR